MAFPPSHSTEAKIPAAHLRKAELVGTIRRIERVLANAKDTSDWRTQATGEFEVVRSAFAEHRQATEGDHGLYAELPGHAPHLTRRVAALVDEHVQLERAIDALWQRVGSADLEETRRSVRELVIQLFQHRQHGADLVYDAYSTDIGGET